MNHLFHGGIIRYKLYAIPGIFLCCACSFAQTLKSPDWPLHTIASIDSVCTHQLGIGHFPGLAVAVAQKKNQIWSKGYGYANVDKKVPVDPDDDLFRIGSISKSITATALARLTQKGKINLDAPISSYYPALPADKASLTLRQIGGHLAGIRHYKGIEFLSNVRYNNLSDPLEVFLYDSLVHKPGTKYFYSTYGWSLISAVMEKAIEKPFLDILEEEVSSPLRLDDLKADHVDSTSYRRVMHYEYQEGKTVLSPAVDNSNKWAGGGLICSAEDLARYGYAIVEPGYLKEKTLSTFTQSQTTLSGEKINYGIGFRTGTDEKGRAWFGHSGGSVGGTSMLLIYPEEDLVIVTLVNMGSAGMDDLAFKIAEFILESSGAK